MGLFNGRKISCKMEIDVFHRKHLGITTPGGTPFDTENRTQGGLSQYHGCFLTHLVQSFG